MKRLLIISIFILAGCTETPEEKAIVVLNQNIQLLFPDQTNFEIVSFNIVDTVQLSFQETNEYKVHWEERISKESLALEVSKEVLETVKKIDDYFGDRIKRATSNYEIDKRYFERGQEDLKKAIELYEQNPEIQIKAHIDYKIKNLVGEFIERKAYIFFNLPMTKIIKIEPIGI